MDNNYTITLTPFQLATFEGILDWVEEDNADRIEAEKQLNTSPDDSFIQLLQSELNLIYDLQRQIEAQAHT